MGHFPGFQFLNVAGSIPVTRFSKPCNGLKHLPAWPIACPSILQTHSWRNHMNNNIIPACIIGAGLFARCYPQACPLPNLPRSLRPSLLPLPPPVSLGRASR